jgi:hypothetical protein
LGNEASRASARSIAASGGSEKPYGLIASNRWNLGGFGKEVIDFIHAGEVPTALVAFTITGSRLTR